MAAALASPHRRASTVSRHDIMLLAYGLRPSKSVGNAYRWDRPLASARRAAVRAGCLCLGQHRRQQPFAVSPATVCSHLSTRSSDADRCCWQHHPQEWLGADDVQGPWEAGAAHGPRLRALCRWALHTKRHRPGAAEFTWRRSLGRLLTVSFELHPLSELLRAGLDR